MSFSLRGVDRLLSKVETVIAAAPEIAQAGVKAGANSIAAAMSNASPPNVAARVAVRITQEGKKTVAKITLRPNPQRTSPPRPPSSYKRPKTYLAQAMRNSRAASKRAMVKAARAKIREAAKGK